ncbi:acyl-CoA dehydrogenase family protein [Luminiphilus sp.]|nr:acyl-CoA dehydrogenase family protein [Luminiphilus sp.]MDA8739036.1 acyl-CoA dehydrogenase family protein [Luminiphilus sp.]MDA8945922.1 acyl-CoA dehydrogenase family protein [Luminiphilus sp.]MDB2313217.1 acyl-CoA dehydrogenase family protein [Luminiphilus sp.]MDB2379575.1 acyl-CoA dehydrogenase family protein [Luminiphilus sp.]
MTEDALSVFRAEVADWLDRHCPVSQRQPIVREEQIWGGRRRVFPSDEARSWFEACRDKGYTAPDWPVAYGGAGLDAEQEKILKQEMSRLGCRPPLYCQGLWMLGPALLVYGSEDQKREHLGAICRGEIRWAQGYSEPSAGSDLANLKTKAEDCGDHFLVNGTKIWTTKADEADWIFCLVRTRDAAPKQAGISFLLIDMASEGVSTSPIPLISGDSEFCQTFFDNVRVPKRNLVGAINEGWAVAKELLNHERKMMAAFEGMLEKPAMALLELAHYAVGVNEDGRLADPELRSDIVSHLMRETGIRQMGERIYRQGKTGQMDARLPLLMKYLGTSQAQVKDELILAALGGEGLSMDDESVASEGVRKMVKQWAFNKSLTIAGGTSEVQLNIIAKRALGMASGERRS